MRCVSKHECCFERESCATAEGFRQSQEQTTFDSADKESRDFTDRAEEEEPKATLQKRGQNDTHDYSCQCEWDVNNGHEQRDTIILRQGKRGVHSIEEKASMVRYVGTFISRRLPVELTSIVDVQGCRKNQEFILKSLCVLDIYTFQFFVFHFKPPCSAEELSALDVKTNRFIFENLNGKPWESGEYPYHERSKIISPILRKHDRIYLKGTEKNQWINKHARCERVNFIDLINYGCPSLEKC